MFAVDENQYKNAVKIIKHENDVKMNMPGPWVSMDQLLGVTNRDFATSPMSPKIQFEAILILAKYYNKHYLVERYERLAQDHAKEKKKDVREDLHHGVYTSKSLADIAESGARVANARADVAQAGAREAVYTFIGDRVRLAIKYTGGNDVQFLDNGAGLKLLEGVGQLETRHMKVVQSRKRAYDDVMTSVSLLPGSSFSTRGFSQAVALITDLVEEGKACKNLVKTMVKRLRPLESSQTPQSGGKVADQLAVEIQNLEGNSSAKLAAIENKNAELARATARARLRHLGAQVRLLVVNRRANAAVVRLGLGREAAELRVRNARISNTLLRTQITKVSNTATRHIRAETMLRGARMLLAGIIVTKTAQNTDLRNIINNQAPISQHVADLVQDGPAVQMTGLLGQLSGLAHVAMPAFVPHIQAMIPVIEQSMRLGAAHWHVAGEDFLTSARKLFTYLLASSPISAVPFLRDLLVYTVTGTRLYQSCEIPNTATLRDCPNSSTAYLIYNHVETEFKCNIRKMVTLPVPYKITQAADRAAKYKLLVNDMVQSDYEQLLPESDNPRNNHVTALIAVLEVFKLRHGMRKRRSTPMFMTYAQMKIFNIEITSFYARRRSIEPACVNIVTTMLDALVHVLSFVVDRHPAVSVAGGVNRAHVRQVSIAHFYAPRQPQFAIGV
jgi:hypothetical protein